MIDKEQPAVDIFQLKKAGGSKGSGTKLVPIIPTESVATELYYKRNAKQWLPRVLDASVAAADTTNSRYHTSFLLFKALKRLEPKAFDDVLQISKNGSGKMDIHRQIAMVKIANITYSQQRVIRPFFIADKCNPLHSEHQVRKQEIKTSHGGKPIFIQFKEEQYSQNGWYLPVDKVIKDTLECQRGRTTQSLTDSELHVIMSADHGQGHWKANVACVLIRNGSVVMESNTVVASVECRKDKRQVLIDCGVPAKINESLLTLREGDNGGTGVVTAPGTAAVPPIKLFATGDLAWFSEALGKPNMSGDHCALCQWRCVKASSSKADPKQAFTPWLSMEQLKLHYSKLENKEFDRTDKSQECGVVATPLIDAIDPPDYITPLLHCVTLFINTPFKYLHRWIWYRVEGIAPVLIHARDELALASLEKDRLWEESLEAQEHLQLMYTELEDLAPDDCNVFEDKDHETEYRQQRLLVQVAEEAVEEADLAHDTAVAAVRKASAKVNRLEGLKGHGRAHQDLWMTIENRLKELKVYSSAYHGGDMEGNQ